LLNFATTLKGKFDETCFSQKRLHLVRLTQAQNFRSDFNFMIFMDLIKVLKDTIKESTLLVVGLDSSLEYFAYNSIHRSIIYDC